MTAILMSGAAPTASNSREYANVNTFKMFMDDRVLGRVWSWSSGQDAKNGQNIQICGVVCD
ncbi:MAG: hypothetical protein ACK5MO_06880, partial [Planctomyces sp.]